MTLVDEDAEMANPASVYCEQYGGKLEIRTDETGGQMGICIFADGSECEEWAYFRGECAPASALQDTPTPAQPSTEPTTLTPGTGCRWLEDLPQRGYRAVFRVPTGCHSGIQ